MATKYYKQAVDGSISKWTESAAIAEAWGLTDTTEREFVMAYDGRTFFAGEAPARPVTYADYDEAMEAHLDAEKAARGYTKREPTDYAASGVSRYAQDAADWTAHRDAVMLYGLDVQNRAAAGQPVPTLSEFKAGLPVIQWTLDN